MAIRVAGSTFAFGKIDLEASCKIMQEMGFDVVDVGACGMSTFTDYVPSGSSPTSTTRRARPTTSGAQRRSTALKSPSSSAATSG